MQLENIRILCDEVSSLVDAGLPLEAHLADAGKGHGSRLKSLTEEISRQMEQGDSLQDVISNGPSGMPSFVPASIAAGIRTGRLSDSVEIMGDAASAMLSVRRNLVHSVTYPFLVLMVACLLFSLFVSRYLASIRFLLTDFRLEQTALFQLVQWNKAWPWWPMVAPAIGLLILVVWFVSGRAATLSFRGLERLLLVLPGVSGLIRNLHRMTFGRILSLMVDRSVPLPDALVLAGNSCGDAEIAAASSVAAEQIRLGRGPLAESGSELPPMFAACLDSATVTEQQLKVRLPAITAFYERRIQIGMSWLGSVIPVLMLVVIGGGAVALYAVSVFWPMTQLFYLLPGN